MKFFSKKTFLLVAGVIALLVISAVGGVLIYVSSPGFKEKARQYAVQQIELETGGHATLGRLYWNLWTRRVTLLDLTLRGTEPADGAPLLHVESIDVGVTIRTLLQKKINLFELTVTRPAIRLLVDAKGNTNLPNPPARDNTGRVDYPLSIENFKVAQGTAFVDERQIDLDFVVRNLNADLNYQSITRVLTASASYDGVLQGPSQPAIPYSLSSDFDFTRGTILAKHVVISTGKTQLQLQGRINDVLTSNIAGTLAYSGTAALPFLNYFLSKENFSGEAALAGEMQFSKAGFQTHGSAKAGSIGVDNWNATQLSANYDYRYPEKRLALDAVSLRAFGGTAEGKLSVDALPGPSTITLNLAYKDVDGASLTRVYPWGPKYRIDSQITGNLQGSLAVSLKQYDISGDATFVSSVQKPAAGVISLPLDGNLGFAIGPDRADVRYANIHFLSTTLTADGPIGTNALSMNVHLASSDLSNLSFLYPDANGAGSFDGVLGGPLKTPRAEGTFDIQRYKYRDWTVEKASGMAGVDLMTNIATLTNVHVVQGQSQITLYGTTALDGMKVDLRIQAAQIHAEDIQPFVKQQFGGVLSGAIHLTSFNPLRFDGDVRATGLAYRNQTLRDLQTHVQYDAPSIALQNLTAADGGSTLTGRATYNTATEAMTFALHVGAIDLERLRTLGLPDAVSGVVQQADVTGSGTLKHPEVDGNARLQNLTFHGETFPTARVDVDTSGSRVTLKVSEVKNLTLTAQVDTAGNGYPFTAQATLMRYSIEKLAGFTRGTVTLSGDASLKGSLNDIAHISGSGHVDPVEVVVQGQTLKSTKPFSFDFNSERLNLSDVTIASSIKGTQLDLAGTVGLTPGAKLNLTVTGEVDAGLLAADPAWTIGGTVNVKGQIGGTLAKPDLQGRASFADFSLARQGVTTSLTAFKGDVIFDEHRMTLSNVEGKSGGGTIRVQGTGTIEGETIGALNLRIDASSVRLRYPAGLRSVIDGTLTVGGTMAAPSVSGDLQIQSMTFNSSFDEFLALFSAGTGSGPSPLGNLQLALRVVGSRNISIHNELASAEARIDLGIKGTLDDPALTGHVETSSGTLLFQGRKYDVTRGNIDFVDPVRIDPSINIQAETTVRSYQVYLSISGRMNRLQLNMRSEPPLPQLEIVNLISGGKTTDELGESARNATPTGEQLFQGGAASILSDMLVSRVGSKFNLLGLDRIVRIDPFVVGAQNATTARITLSEQLTKDLSVTYSQTLASDKQQIVQIEYFITKNVSVLASKDEDDVRALDLRIRKRF